MATPFGTRPARPAMPDAQRAVTNIQDFLGLNTLSADNKLKPGEQLESNNVRYGEGYVEKRPGYTLLASKANLGGISFLDIFTNNAGAETIMVYSPIAAPAGVLPGLYRVTGSTLTLVVALSTGTMAQSQGGVSYQDNYYFVNGNGTDPYKKITSAFVASTPALKPIHADTSPVNLSGLVLFLDRIYGWGDPLFRRRLYYCATSNGDNWQTAGAGFVDLPGNIISVAKGASSLLISTDVENGEIVSAYGNNPIYRTIEASSQASSQHSFIGVKNSIMYVTEQGLKSLGQVERLPRGTFEGDLSRIIRPDFRKLSKSDGTSVYGKNEHTLFMALKSSAATVANDVLLCLDDELGRYSYDTGITTKAMTTDKAGIVYIADNTSTVSGGLSSNTGMVYKVSAMDPRVKTNYSDNGRPINFDVTTGWINPANNPDITHLLRDIRLYFRVDQGTTISVDLFKDYDGTIETFSFQLIAPEDATVGTIWGVPLFGTRPFGGTVAQLDPTFRYFQRQAPHRLWFNFLKIRVRNNENNQYVRLEGIKITSIPRPLRHYGRPSVISGII